MLSVASAAPFKWPEAAPARRSLIAVVTSVARAYVHGAIVLGCSLNVARNEPAGGVGGHAFDMLAFHIGLNDTAQAALATVGWRVLSPPATIINPRGNEAKVQLRGWQHDYTYKLTPWSLYQYERVVVLDADMLLVDPSALQQLFDHPWRSDATGDTELLVARDCAAIFIRPKEASDEFNTGVMVLRPSVSRYRDMLAAVHTLGSADGGAQGFLIAYWRSANASRLVGWLPTSRYNYLVQTKCVRIFERSDGMKPFDPALLPFRNHSKRAWVNYDEETEAVALRQLHGDVGWRIGLLHFHHSPKPWHCRQRDCGHEWQAGTTMVRPLQALWHAAARGRCAAPLRRVGYVD